MIPWLLIGAIVVLLIVLLWSQNRTKEGFTTVDLNTAQAQRQMLQWEGERRYNSLARAQAPQNIIPAAQVQAAVQQVAPIPTTRTASLLTMLGGSLVGAADDGTNKQGQGVEQTGMVQEKINFCESITSLDCSQLSDPRLAECGLCLDGGKNSNGNFWRGGMYISSDDQIRANEASNASGSPAVYKPTVGSCPAQNFVLMPQNCQAVTAQLQCLQAGAPTSSNTCGSCYGGSPGGYQGLVVVGDKTKPYAAMLHVSHPGGHSYGGAGLVVTDQNGNTLATMAYSQQPLLDPQAVPLSIQEGQNITITVYGAPAVWCGWLSDPAGMRTVSLDIGVQTITPAIGFEIAGDKNAGVVTGSMSAANGVSPATWLNFQSTVPNTVMWYVRRSEAVPPMVTQAWYGTTPPNASAPVGYDVTQLVKAAATTGSKQFTIVPSVFATAATAPAGGDPSPGTPKTLFIFGDTGGTQLYPDGTTLTGAMFGNSMTLAVTVPATLVGPLLPDDQAACPTGPMVWTEIGAGLMGSHSCFTASGAFNTVPYCLQELFQAAGGTQKGQAWPATQAAAAALVQNDPTTGQPSLDATVAYLNNLGSIAQYGVTSAGAPADFATQKAASLAMLGTAPLNPCQTPNEQTGPQSPECLDYLYRTSGNPAQDNQPVDPTTLPYAYCNAAGAVAPLNPDGSVNQSNVDTANGLGSITNIRGYYQGLYTKTQDTSDFMGQITAMQQCFGAILKPPVETPATCPPPNPDEWHCITPDLLQGSTQGISDTAVPAYRSALGTNQCASQDGQNCYMFPSAAACSAWTQNQSSLNLTGINANNPSQQGMPAGTGWQGAPIVAVTGGGQPGLYYNRPGTNILNWIETCTPCNDGYNVCTGNYNQTLDQSVAWQQYVQGPNFVCGQGGPIDQYLRQSV